LPETCWATIRREIKNTKVTSSWFFLSTLNYDARSTTHQICALWSNNYMGFQVSGSVKYGLLSGNQIWLGDSMDRTKGAVPPSRSWLRLCAKSLKVARSIPSGVTGIFYWYNSSARTVTLDSTQPVIEMSTKNICWGGKDNRRVWLTTKPPFEIWEP
jgi:hypothetical protein